MEVTNSENKNWVKLIDLELELNNARSPCGNFALGSLGNCAHVGERSCCLLSRKSHQIPSGLAVPLASCPLEHTPSIHRRSVLTMVGDGEMTRYTFCGWLLVTILKKIVFWVTTMPNPPSTSPVWRVARKTAGSARVSWSSFCSSYGLYFIHVAQSVEVSLPIINTQVCWTTFSLRRLTIDDFSSYSCQDTETFPLVLGMPSLFAQASVTSEALMHQNRSR